MTSERLGELQNQVTKGNDDEKYTAIILASHCKQIDVPERDPDQSIANVDHKSISAGLAFKETVAECDDDLEAIQNSIDHLQDNYYSLLETLEHQCGDSKTPIFQLVDGEIPSSAAHFYLSPCQTRIITEHAFLSLGVDSLSHAPIPPLYLLSCLSRSTKDKTARAPPKGSALYVALAPPELLRLRGPELLRLGLADYFIPDAKYVDTLKEMKNNAPCPAPHTTEAVKIVLEMHKAYAGPDKIGVWAKEIEQVFGGEGLSVTDIYAKLNEVNKPWSDTIVKHLKTQSPTLLATIVRAIQTVMEQELSLDECLDLEKQLNAHWRRTLDYKIGAEGQIPENSELNNHIPSWPDLDVDLLARLFESTRPALVQDKIRDYQLPENQKEEEETDAEAEIFVCPVTGMRGKMPEGHAPVALHSPA